MTHACIFGMLGEGEIVVWVCVSDVGVVGECRSGGGVIWGCLDSMRVGGWRANGVHVVCVRA